MQSTQTTLQAPSIQANAVGRRPSGRLKYAEPRDLPSFPSLGLRESDAAASAAATLGWASQKPAAPAPPAEPSRKPADSNPSSTNLASPASTAALLAKDYKTSPTWTPEKERIGPRAAIIAAAGGLARRQENSGGRSSPIASPAMSPTSTWGSSAANQAFRAGSVKHLAVPSQPELVTRSSRGSLRAAKDAMASAGAGRPRAVSSPTQQPRHHDSSSNITGGTVATAHGESSGATANALTAATAAHHRRARSMGGDETTGAVPYTTMGRQMFTSHPPVQLEVDEQKRADILHASAVAMAKRMYNRQQQQQQQQQGADTAAFRAAQTEHSPSTSASPETGGQRQYTNLQEAAYKLAQERLSKLQEEHSRERAFQDYYGGAGASSPSSLGRSRFPILGKLRRRSSSDGAVGWSSGGLSGVESKQQQRRPRTTSMFADPSTGRPVAYDDPSFNEKRQRDREALLAAARRNVKAQLEGIDRKVMAETGMVPPTLHSEWELKAHAAAQARSAAGGGSSSFPASKSVPGAVGRKSVDTSRNTPPRNPAGKVDIGGGKFMEQSEIDEIAARRVQPFLDEINEKAEQERERLAALQAEEERKREEAEGQRAREREVREIHERLKSQQKEQEKARKEEIKREERARRNLEKEQKRQAKEEKRPSKEMSRAPQQQPHQEADPEAAPLGRSASAAPAEGRSPEEKNKLSRGLHHLSIRLPGKLNPHSKDRDKDKEADPQSNPSKPTFSPTSAGDVPVSPPGTLEDTGSSPTSKMRIWLKSRFRGRSKSSGDAGSLSSSGKKGGFIGGAALSAATASGSGQHQHQRSGSESSSSSLGVVDESGNDSMREVALAGRGQPKDAAGSLSRMAAASTTPRAAVGDKDTGAIGVGNGSVDSLSSSSNQSSGTGDSTSTAGSGGGENFVLAKEHLDGSGRHLSPPPTIRDPARTTKTGSPVRDSRFLEMME